MSIPLNTAYHRWRKAKSLVMSYASFACALVVIAPLGLVLFSLFKSGISSINLAFFTKLPMPPGETGGGMANAIVGTLLLMGLACLIGVPTGVFGGVYLAEYGRERVNWWIRFAADVLNGVPSIVWGIVTWALVVKPMHGYSAYAAGVALGFIMIPLVIRTTEEVVLLVPNGYREAALALGISRWKVVVRIVMKTAFKGIVTGVLLAAARIAGETAPLLFTAFGNQFWTHNLRDPIDALPLRIFNYAMSPYDDWIRQAWAGALVLILLVLVINISVRILTRGKSHPTRQMNQYSAISMDRIVPSPATPALAVVPDSSATERSESQTRPSETAVDVRHLSVWFGNQRVLHNVSLQVPTQAVTAIIGPSGCGKSTFLRSLNRLHDLVPSARVAGHIDLFGEDLYARHVDPTLVRRRVGMVFQKSNPFPTMSIAENVTVGLRLNGLRRRQVLQERLEESLHMAALWDEVKDRLDAPAVSLSGGQQQRLCIARALAVRPDVLLMDEPASALDPIATSRIEDLILELKKDFTIVIVTHNMQQAARISDFTAFFYLGELIEYDATTKIFSNPSKKQTEDYVTGRFG